MRRARDKALLLRILARDLMHHATERGTHTPCLGLEASHGAQSVSGSLHVAK